MVQLGEPYLLASYATPSQSTPKVAEKSSRSKLRSVYANCVLGPHGKDYSTVAVQGDGIHVLHLGTMHPVISRTLGPSTFFAAPVAIRVNGSETITSYAVIHSDGTKPLDAGRKVWMWKEDISRLPEARSEAKKSVVFPRPIAVLWVHHSLPSHVVAVSTSGKLMIMSDETQVVTLEKTKKQLEAANADSSLIRSFMFSTEDCSFLPHQWKDVKGVAILCFVQTSGHLRLDIKVVRPTSEVETITERNMGNIKDILDISCDSSGVITVLSSTGEWKQFNLDSHGLDPTKTLHISLLSDGDKNSTDTRFSISSIGASFILMARFESASSRDIMLLLWDVQYEVIIASQKVSLPSSLGLQADLQPILELIPCTSRFLLSVSLPVVVSGKNRTADVVSSRSALFIIPVTVSSPSSIALAMGKSLSTGKWLCNPQNTWDDFDRRKVLGDVTAALEKGLPNAADMSFFAWVQEETLRIETRKSKAATDEDDGGVRPNTRRQQFFEPRLRAKFVSDILNNVLPPGKQINYQYSSKIVQYMIQRRVVSHDMIEGGLIQALRRHGDWDSILLALRFVDDLPEGQIMPLLSDIIQQHRSNTGTMEVDTNMPTPVVFLALLVNYPMSNSAACLASKNCLSDVRDLTCILEILNGWLLRWDENESDLVGCTNETTEDGESIILPRLYSIITFLKILLDAHFLTLLDYPPAIELVQQLSRHLDRQLGVISDLSRLHGALEAFGHAHTLKAQNLKRESSVQQKSKKALEATELSIGMYRLEEVTL